LVLVEFINQRRAAERVSTLLQSAELVGLGFNVWIFGNRSEE
jgi:hypothetical protein